MIQINNDENSYSWWNEKYWENGWRVWTVILSDDGKKHNYELEKFARSNAGTCINHRPIVSVGEKVNKGDVLADGPSMDDGELALGQNVTIAFMTWHGYNYEDAIIMSERMVKDDVYTSIHIDEYSIEKRKTKLGEEKTEEIEAFVVKNGEMISFMMTLGELTDEERQIILKGCLINYNRV